MKRKDLKILALIWLALFLILGCNQPGQKDQGNQYVALDIESIALCKTCPPGFLLNEKNQCISKNLYQQYESLQDVGVGGLKTALPEVRQGAR